MTTQNPNAVNPSVILPFSAICNFEVPTTELDPDFVPSITVCVGDFATFDEAKAAYYVYADHSALISAWCYQSMREEYYPAIATSHNAGGVQ